MLAIDHFWLPRRVRLLSLMLASLALFTVSLAFLRPAHGQAPPGLTELLDRTTVLVLSYNRETLSTDIGSGVFITPDTVLTNRHVVATMDPTLIRVTNRAIGRLVPATILAQSTDQDQAGSDFALLKLSQPAPSAVAIQITEQVDRLTPVIAAGYPGVVTSLGFHPHLLMWGNLGQIPELVVSSGEVNAVQPGRAVRSVIHTAQISRGSSGGPLVDRCGRMVGINTTVYTGQAQGATVDRAQAALHAEAIKAFLDKHGVRPRLAQGACQGTVERVPPSPRVALASWPRPTPLTQSLDTASYLTARQRTEIQRGVANLSQAHGSWAVAIPPVGGGDGTMFAINTRSAEDAERIALERCEFWASAPCQITIRDGAVLPTSVGRPMAVMAPTSTTFDPNMIPFISGPDREMWGVSYQRLTQPKAMVLHPQGIAIRAVGATAAEASSRAMSVCRAIRAQSDPALCFVYAVDNRSVVGRINRSSVLSGALTPPTANNLPARPATPAPAPAPAARPAVQAPTAPPAPRPAPPTPAQTSSPPATSLPPSGGDR
ncbi:MAG: serine protease [Alphaproteobacteria bacterium]|nr:MAG: serine protease [Alphaproteobacteria bacterium]